MKGVGPEIYMISGFHFDFAEAPCTEGVVGSTPARPTRCRRPREAKEDRQLLLGPSLNPRMALYNPSR